MRPLGGVALALLRAAQEPGTVQEVCVRAQVGTAAGRYTASRLIGRGALVVLDPGRPAVVRAAQPARGQFPQSDAHHNEIPLAEAMRCWGGGYLRDQAPPLWKPAAESSASLREFREGGISDG
jgi:hypothetical protein